MDIKELEFIRDFSNHIDLLKQDITDLALAMDEEGYQDGTTFEKVIINNLWSISHQAQAVMEILDMFREDINRKYWSEWHKANPHVNPDYDKHHQNPVF